MSDTNNITTILTFVGYFIMVPIYLIALALIILAIIGKVKKDFSKFKKVLKIWAWLWLALLILIIIYGINSYFINSGN